MPQLNDLSRSLVTLEQDATLIAVIEMSQSSWLVAGIVPRAERQPLKKLAVDESTLLKLLDRWREEAEKAGCRRRDPVYRQGQRRHHRQPKREKRRIRCYGVSGEDNATIVAPANQRSAPCHS